MKTTKTEQEYGYIKLRKNLLASKTTRQLYYKEGATGLGVYIILILHLAACEDCIGAYNVDNLAILAVMAKKRAHYINHIITDFGLFDIVDDQFTSRTLQQSMNIKNSLSEALDEQEEDEEEESEGPSHGTRHTAHASCSCKEECTEEAEPAEEDANDCEQYDWNEEQSMQDDGEEYSYEKRRLAQAKVQPAKKKPGFLADDNLVYASEIAYWYPKEEDPEPFKPSEELKKRLLMSKNTALKAFPEYKVEEIKEKERHEKAREAQLAAEKKFKEDLLREEALRKKKAGNNTPHDVRKGNASSQNPSSGHTVTACKSAKCAPSSLAVDLQTNSKSIANEQQIDSKRFANEQQTNGKNNLHNRNGRDACARNKDKDKDKNKNNQNNTSSSTTIVEKKKWRKAPEKVVEAAEPLDFVNKIFSDSTWLHATSHIVMLPLVDDILLRNRAKNYFLDQ